MIYDVAYDKVQGAALILPQGGAVPQGFLAVGQIDVPDTVYPASNVAFQMVRDLLYTQSLADKDTFGILDMQRVDIFVTEGVNVSYVTSISGLQSAYSLRMNDKSYDYVRVNGQAWPPHATNTNLVYSVADTDVATVTADGELRAVGIGETVLTITAPGSTGGALKREIPVVVGGQTDAIPATVISFNSNNAEEFELLFTPPLANLDGADYKLTVDGEAKTGILTTNGFTTDYIDGAVNYVFELRFTDGRRGSKYAARFS